MRLRKVVFVAASSVFLICVYAFLLGNGIFEGKFENEEIAWYFLAKGIFCAVSLYLTYRIIALLEKR